MFGYVKPLHCRLDEENKALFKSYYCGVCLSLKEDFGELSRFALNYDMTFLSILLDGLSPLETTKINTNCIVSPFKKKDIMLKNKAISYSSSLNVALVYYKILDDTLDDNSFLSKGLSRFFIRYRNKLQSSYNGINKVIQDCLRELNTLEENLSFSSLDEISHPFSHMLGSILKNYPYEINEDGEEIREKLYAFGYALGKWIYLIDAYDDLDKDMKKGRFNPINILYNKADNDLNTFSNEITPRIEFILMNCCKSCTRLLRELPINKNREIINNIVALGLKNKYKSVKKKYG